MLAMERKVAEIEHLMGPIMNGMQAKHLHAVLSSCLLGVHQGGEDLILDYSVFFRQKGSRAVLKDLWSITRAL